MKVLKKSKETKNRKEFLEKVTRLAAHINAKPLVNYQVVGKKQRVAGDALSMQPDVLLFRRTNVST